ncbi:MAG: archaeal proteasome endopeptidase complex subunit alpha [Nanobdellota archaeon]
MEPLNHQMMGYDRAVSMFSPDGRLLQVEYAKKTVKQGSTTIAISCQDGVVIVAEKKLPSKLVVSDSVEKIYQIDDHIAATFAGITSDARILLERSQVKAQQHKITYDSEIDTISVVKDISDLKQYTTQSGGLRPFGTALLIAGIDIEGPKVYMTDPTGIYFQYNAVAVGADESKIMEVLESKYKQDMNIEDAIKLAIEALNQKEEKVNSDKLEIATINKNEKKFNKMNKEDIKKYV